MSLIEVDLILHLVSKIIILKNVLKKIMGIKFQKDQGNYKFKNKTLDLILITDFLKIILQLYISFLQETPQFGFYWQHV